MAITLLILSIIAAWFSWQLVKLLRNYIIVRTLGLPILFTPFGLVNPVWKIGESYLAPLLRRLPFGLANFVEYSSVSCLFTDRYMRHAQLGPAYVVVSPAENVIIIADAAAAMDVLLRRTDFDKPEGVYKPLELFGPNVDTVNGGDWQRHRRLTTPPFSERNSKLVWKESLVQANDMLRTWMSKGRAGIGGVEQDAMTLALHVIASAGFGKSYPFSGGVQYPAEGHSLSYREALNLVLTNVFLTIIIASVSLPSILLPRKVAEVKQGLIEFKQYMVEMVEEERRSSRHHGSEKDNLMSILIRAAASDGNDKGRKGFTDNEIFGNLFIFNLAGHHTTANTIVYALVMLSAHPQWQDWVYEELTTVFEGKEKVEDWDYNSAFPQLKRCLAVMVSSIHGVESTRS
jgi:cytochrome P450